MRIEKVGSENKPEHKVWLTQKEYQDLKMNAPGTRATLIVRLAGESGLRSFEILQIKPKHVKENQEKEGSWLIRIPEGKDTQKGTGKPRDAWLPKDLKSKLSDYAFDNGISNDEPFIDVSKKTIERDIKRACQEMHERSGNSDWLLISPHDLRRYFAHHNLVTEGKNPEVLMEIGGWKDYSALKPYLDKPTEKEIAKTMEK